MIRNQASVRARESCKNLANQDGRLLRKENSPVYEMASLISDRRTHLGTNPLQDLNMRTW